MLLHPTSHTPMPRHRVPPFSHTSRPSHPTPIPLHNMPRYSPPPPPTPTPSHLSPPSAPPHLNAAPPPRWEKRLQQSSPRSSAVECSPRLVEVDEHSHIIASLDTNTGHVGITVSDTGDNRVKVDAGATSASLLQCQRLTATVLAPRWHQTALHQASPDPAVN